MTEALLINPFDEERTASTIARVYEERKRIRKASQEGTWQKRTSFV
jgi:hypothetical protein